MQFQNVSSRVIKAVGYEAATQQMVVVFAGSRYKYTGIAQSVYDALVSASSVGKHFLDNIKGQYPCSKIES